MCPAPSPRGPCGHPTKTSPPSLLHGSPSRGVIFRLDEGHPRGRLFIYTLPSSPAAQNCIGRALIAGCRRIPVAFGVGTATKKGQGVAGQVLELPGILCASASSRQPKQGGCCLEGLRGGGRSRQRGRAAGSCFHIETRSVAKGPLPSHPLPPACCRVLIYRISLIQPPSAPHSVSPALQQRRWK